MSAAAARRKKQLAAKQASLSESGLDPISKQLNSLLESSETIDESTAYEALQLAQSQVRKSVKSGDFNKATNTYGYDVALKILNHNRASVASQLLILLSQVLTETHTPCTEEWIQKIQTLDESYLRACAFAESKVEQVRLYKLHAKFLRNCLGWSEALGTTTLGALPIHALVAKHSWFLSESAAETESSENEGDDVDGEDEDEDEDANHSKMYLQAHAITHYALAEQPQEIIAKLRSMPNPTEEETQMGHVCPPCAREALLTRAILVFCTVENLRDATLLLKTYLTEIESRDLKELSKSYMSKTDKKSPSPAIFCSMLLEILKKDKKTGPLYTWLLKGFSNSELMKMYKPEILKGYTTKIGRTYFDIQPPPGMMSTLESMMGMMGGMGGMGGGAGGLGGMNPAMMQQMMQQMGGMGL
jgi:hypothetical protein